MIPKIVHQAWCGPKPIPEREKAWCAAMREMNPDFKVILHGNELLERYGRDTYVAELVARGEAWAFITDRLRCLLLRDEGGIWLDPDGQPIRPLNKLNNVWDDEKITFVHGLRHPLREGVTLHRGITFADDTFLASAKNSRIINRVMEAWKPERVVVNGHDIGVQVMTYIDHDVCTLGYKYFYDVVKGPDTIYLHDCHNAGSWVVQNKLQQLNRVTAIIHRPQPA